MPVSRYVRDNCWRHHFTMMNMIRIWFEVPLWMEARKTVRDTLIEVDPANPMIIAPMPTVISLN